MGVCDLARVPFIPVRESSVVREAVLEYLRKFKISPKVALECSSHALLKEFVRRDNGVAFIERCVVEEELDQCLLKEVRITEGSPTIAVAIGYLNRRELSPPARTFLRLLTQAGKNTAPAIDATTGTGITPLSPAAPKLPLHKKSAQLGLVSYQSSFERLDVSQKEKPARDAVVAREGKRMRAHAQASRSLQEHDGECCNQYAIDINERELGCFE
jgi:hypothetical protein